MMIVTGLGDRDQQQWQRRRRRRRRRSWLDAQVGGAAVLSVPIWIALLLVMTVCTGIVLGLDSTASIAVSTGDDDEDEDDERKKLKVSSWIPALGSMNAPTLFEQHFVREYFLALGRGAPHSGGSGIVDGEGWTSLALPRWWGDEKKDMASKWYEHALGELWTVGVEVKDFVLLEPILDVFPALDVLGHAYGQFFDLARPEVEAARKLAGGMTASSDGSSSTGGVGVGRLAMAPDVLVERVGHAFDALGTFQPRSKAEARAREIAYNWEPAFEEEEPLSEVTVCHFMREKYMAAGHMTPQTVAEAKESWDRVAGGQSVLTYEAFRKAVCSRKTEKKKLGEKVRSLFEVQSEGAWVKADDGSRSREDSDGDSKGHVGNNFPGITSTDLLIAIDVAADGTLDQREEEISTKLLDLAHDVGMGLTAAEGMASRHRFHVLSAERLATAIIDELTQHSGTGAEVGGGLSGDDSDIDDDADGDIAPWSAERLAGLFEWGEKVANDDKLEVANAIIDRFDTGDEAGLRLVGYRGVKDGHGDVVVRESRLSASLWSSLCGEGWDLNEEVTVQPSTDGVMSTDGQVNPKDQGNTTTEVGPTAQTAAAAKPETHGRKRRRRLLDATWRVFNVEEHLIGHFKADTTSTGSGRQLKVNPGLGHSGFDHTSYEMGPCEFQLLMAHLGPSALDRFNQIKQAREQASGAERSGGGTGETGAESGSAVRVQLSSTARRVAGRFRPWRTWFGLYSHKWRAKVQRNAGIQLKRAMKSLSQFNTLEASDWLLLNEAQRGLMMPHEFRLALQGVVSRNRIFRDALDERIFSTRELFDRTAAPPRSEARNRYSSYLLETLRCERHDENYEMPVSSSDFKLFAASSAYKLFFHQPDDGDELSQKRHEERKSIIYRMQSEAESENKGQDRCNFQVEFALSELKLANSPVLGDNSEDTVTALRDRLKKVACAEVCSIDTLSSTGDDSVETMSKVATFCPVGHGRCHDPVALPVGAHGGCLRESTSSGVEKALNRFIVVDYHKETPDDGGSVQGIYVELTDQDQDKKLAMTECAAQEWEFSKVYGRVDGSPLFLFTQVKAPEDETVGPVESDMLYRCEPGVEPLNIYKTRSGQTLSNSGQVGMELVDESFEDTSFSDSMLRNLIVNVSKLEKSLSNVDDVRKSLENKIREKQAEAIRKQKEEDDRYRIALDNFNKNVTAEKHTENGNVVGTRNDSRIEEAYVREVERERNNDIQRLKAVSKKEAAAQKRLEAESYETNQKLQITHMVTEKIRAITDALSSLLLTRFSDIDLETHLVLRGKISNRLQNYLFPEESGDTVPSQNLDDGNGLVEDVMKIISTLSNVGDLEGLKPKIQEKLEELDSLKQKKDLALKRIREQKELLLSEANELEAGAEEIEKGLSVKQSEVNEMSVSEPEQTKATVGGDTSTEAKNGDTAGGTADGIPSSNSEKASSSSSTSKSSVDASKKSDHKPEKSKSVKKGGGSDEMIKYRRKIEEKLNFNIQTVLRNGLWRYYRETAGTKHGKKKVQTRLYVVQYPYLIWFDKKKNQEKRMEVTKFLFQEQLEECFTSGGLECMEEICVINDPDGCKLNIDGDSADGVLNKDVKLNTEASSKAVLEKDPYGRHICTKPAAIRMVGGPVSPTGDTRSTHVWVVMKCSNHIGKEIYALPFYDHNWARPERSATVSLLEIESTAKLNAGRFEVIAKFIELDGRESVKRRKRVACLPKGEGDQEQHENSTAVTVAAELTDCDMEHVMEGARSGADVYKAMSQRTCAKESETLDKEEVTPATLMSFLAHAHGMTSTGRSIAQRMSEDIMRHYGRLPGQDSIAYPEFTARDFVLSLANMPQLFEGVQTSMEKPLGESEIVDEEAFHVFWACASAFAAEVESPAFRDAAASGVSGKVGVSCGHAWRTRDIDPHIFCSEDAMASEEKIQLKDMIEGRCARVLLQHMCSQQLSNMLQEVETSGLKETTKSTPMNRVLEHLKKGDHCSALDVLICSLRGKPWVAEASNEESRRAFHAGLLAKTDEEGVDKWWDTSVENLCGDVRQ